MSKSLDDVIRIVENLLRHAESAAKCGSGEAQSYFDKAQQLMLKYQVEESKLFGEKKGKGIIRREYHINAPYFLDKATLLNSIAKQNFCRVLRGKGYVAIYGHESDIEFTIVLYQSLLVSMISEMNIELKKVREVELVLSQVSWKKSFFAGYAYRIGERLAEIRNSSDSGYALVITDKEHEISEFWNSLTDGASTTRVLSSVMGFDSGKVSGGRVDLGQTKINGLSALNK